MIIGAVDTSLFNTVMHYYPVLERWFWGIAIVDIKVKGVSLNVCSKAKPCDGVLDTGTT